MCILVDTAGRGELSLSRDAWDPSDLDLLRVRLGAELEVVEKPMRPAELRKMWPHALPWVAAHLWFTSFAMIAGIGVVVAALHG